MNASTRNFLAFLLHSCCIVSAQAGQQEDLDKLRQRISTLQKEIEITGDSHTSAQEALRESERAISHSNRKLHELTAQQQRANAELGKLQHQTRSITADMQNQQAMLIQLLQHQYIHGKQDYLQMMLDTHDPNQTARNLQYYEYIAKNRAKWLNGMRQNLARLTQATMLTQSKSREIEHLKTEQIQQKQSLLKEKESRKKILDRISDQIRQQRKEIGRLQHDESRLSRLVEKLARITREDDTQPARKQSAPPANSLLTRFVSLKGKLPMPVKGKITNRFGARRSDSPVAWKGLFMQSRASEPVFAVADGRVIYADWLRGFGNLLIIDHGSGYMSLYGNNEALYKQVGDNLLAGETIALAGNSGGIENYGLYFELRHEGIPFDPARWIGKRTSRKK